MQYSVQMHFLASKKASYLPPASRERLEDIYIVEIRSVLCCLNVFIRTDFTVYVSTPSFCVMYKPYICMMA